MERIGFACLYRFRTAPMCKSIGVFYASSISSEERTRNLLKAKEISQARAFEMTQKNTFFPPKAKK
jgi:hypothetical protein